MRVPCFVSETRSVLRRRYLLFVPFSLLLLKYTQDAWILHIANQIVDCRGSTVDWSLSQLEPDFNII